MELWDRKYLGKWTHGGKDVSYKIQCQYPAKVLFEISVDVDGNTYLVIFGSHINGGFCCIPNWGIACEMGDPSDTFYNSEGLIRSGLPKSAARAIAAAIRDATNLIIK